MYTRFSRCRSNHLGVRMSGPKFWGMLRPHRSGWGRGWPPKTRYSHMYFCTKFRRCRSSRTGIGRGSPPIGWYQIILLGDRGTCVLTTRPGLHSTSRRPGFKPSIYWCSVQRSNHSATEPHCRRVHKTKKTVHITVQLNLTYPTATVEPSGEYWQHNAFVTLATWHGTSALYMSQKRRLLWTHGNNKNNHNNY